MLIEFLRSLAGTGVATVESKIKLGTKVKIPNGHAPRLHIVGQANLTNKLALRRLGWIGVIGNTSAP